MKPFSVLSLSWRGERRLLLADRFARPGLREEEIRTGNRAWRGASGGIRAAEFHAHTFQGFHGAVFGMHTNRLRQKRETNAFVLDEFVFVGVGGHFIFGAAIDHGDLPGAEAFGDGGAIDGGVARADHDHVAADH